LRVQPYIIEKENGRLVSHLLDLSDSPKDLIFKDECYPKCYHTYDVTSFECQVCLTCYQRVTNQLNEKAKAA